MQYQKVKNRILTLRAKGLSYRQIEKELQCSRSSISYHCGIGQKNKSKKRQQNNRLKLHPFIKKIENFLSSKTQTRISKKQSLNTKQLLKAKLESFFRNRKKKNMNYVKPTISIEDVVNKFGDKPKCYLTGQELDIQSPRTYNFDHIIPVSKGGPNSLDNLGICTRDANQAKNDMMLEDFIDLCKQILQHNGYTITKNTQTY